MPHRILAVDDNPRNLAIIEKALRGEFELVTAASGEQGLEIASRFRPDVVLLDIMMPGIDGYETCRRLRAMRSLAHCKIIMLSARASATDRLDGYSAGANDYVTKPFDLDELLAKLRVYVRLKSVEEVDRLKSELLQLLSHELRTPLGAILMPAELLLSDLTLTSEQRDLVEISQRGGERMLKLIEKVSLLSELKAGLVRRNSQTLVALDVVRCAMRESAERCTVPPSRIMLDIAEVTAAGEDGAGPQVEGDPGQLATALGAILDNALRLSPAHSPVEVRVASDSTWCSITVRDHGPGIAPEFIDHVFDEFVAKDISHHSGGHGLSLATARLIGEQHGGSLTAVSTPGDGATFTLRLPLAESARKVA